MRNAEIPVLLIPKNEEQRIERLYSYDILDTPAEIAFEKIAILASQIFDTPIAQISLVDEDRVFYKSNISPLKAIEIPRADSFCSIAILNEGVTLFENLSEVSELAHNPFVKMENGVKFYAGAPLKTSDGLHLGTVCVLDLTPKTVSAKQLAMLETLSSIVMDELELSMVTRKAMRTQTDFMNRVVHDLKNPTTTISLSADLIKKKKEDPKIVENFADRIKNASGDVLNSLNNLLDLSKIENGSFRLDRNDVDILALLETSIRSFDLSAAQKNQTIKINCNCTTVVSADAYRLREAFDNLISNALKYSYPDTEIHINIIQRDHSLIIEVKDHGQGLTEEDMTKVFTKFARLSAVPTGLERANGLGLSIVKMLIELHQGMVWAESEGKDKGASFFISLPAN